MFKANAPRYIAAISFVLAIAGILNDLVITTTYHKTFDKMDLVKEIISPINLGWALAEFPGRINGLNYTDGVFDIILLLGVVFYAASKYRIEQLVRLFYTLVFCSNVLILCYAVYFFATTKISIKVIFRDGWIELISYLLVIFWIWLSYQILMYFKSNVGLQTEDYGENSYKETSFVSAPLWKRVLHPIIDYIIGFVLFSPIIVSVRFAMDTASHDPFISFHHHSSNVVRLLYIMMIPAYYLIFETLLGITPAKTLTRTRVVDYDGNPAKWHAILVRTLVRLIPFEAFTFFGYNGLHDRLSKTMVACEKAIEAEKVLDETFP